MSQMTTTKTKTTTFYGWMRKQTRRDDPVGDFARDLARDQGFSPARGQHYEHVWARIQTTGACPGAVGALLAARDAYLHTIAVSQPPTGR